MRMSFEAFHDNLKIILKFNSFAFFSWYYILRLLMTYSHDFGILICRLLSMEVFSVCVCVCVCVLSLFLPFSLLLLLFPSGAQGPSVYN